MRVNRDVTARSHHTETGHCGVLLCSQLFGFAVI